MPSLPRRRHPVSKSNISRPILNEAPAIGEYRGDKPLMVIPRTPLPPPPPPVPARPSLRQKPAERPVIQIDDRYEQPTEKTSTQSHFREHLSSSTISYSSSQWEDASMPSSSPSYSEVSFPHFGRDNDGRHKSATDRTPSNPARTAFTRDTGRILPPPPPPPPSVFPVTRTPTTADQVRRGPLGHIIQQRPPPPPPPHSAATSKSRPLNTQTRTDTNQGKWLALGTLRVDRKELKKQEKEARKVRERVEKEVLAAKKKAAREAMKAERK